MSEKIVKIADYESILSDVSELLESARRTTVRSINTIMTATYWLIGKRIVECEQRGKRRADYGDSLIQKLSVDLIGKFGKGFSIRNLRNIRAFYLSWQNRQTVSAKSTSFPLPWSHYVRLLSIGNEEARAFYESEALRGGWSVRQLDRQITSKFYERTLLSRNKVNMLKKGALPQKEEVHPLEEAIRDPYVLEFLDLKDEYSESDLEKALINNLETFLLELGYEFTFVGRQRRLRIGDEWYRIDLLFYHRKLKCLIVIDLKIGKFTHADAGQMHVYLNYAREHWVFKGENPPVGLILCSEKDRALARYALEGLSNKVLASEYRLRLPDETVLVEKLESAREQIGQQECSKRLMGGTR